METYTGRYINPLDPNKNDICIRDIAHHLSYSCRFNGACSKFYSIAQHSILVSILVPNEYALEALLHDAAEAYTSDIVRPLKWRLPEIVVVENLIANKIGKKFGLAHNYKDLITIKRADDIALSAEAYYLMKSKGSEWNLPIPPKSICLEVTLSPEESEKIFLNFFRFLYAERRIQRMVNCNKM